MQFKHKKTNKIHSYTYKIFTYTYMTSHSHRYIHTKKLKEIFWTCLLKAISALLVCKNIRKELGEFKVQNSTLYLSQFFYTT